MKPAKNHRRPSLHLYNPIKEGLGSYDVHYINAYKKNERVKKENSKNKQKSYRYAA